MNNNNAGYDAYLRSSRQATVGGGRPYGIPPPHRGNYYFYSSSARECLMWIVYALLFASLIVLVIMISVSGRTRGKQDDHEEYEHEDDDGEEYGFKQHEFRDDEHRRISDDISLMTGVGDSLPPWFMVNGSSDTLYAFIGRHKYMFVHIQSSTDDLQMYIPTISVDTIISDANTSSLPVLFGGGELGPYNSSCFDTIVPGLHWQQSYDVYIQTDSAAMNASCLTSSFVLCAFTQAWSKYQRSGETVNPMRSLIPTTGGFAGLVQNFRNDISFGAVTGFPNAANILAITSFWWDGTQLFEFDQIYNTATYQYGNYDQSSLSTLVDLQNVMTHEICHVYGAKDTYDPGVCSLSTFYGYAAYRQINKRSLTIDDQTGLAFLYGGVPYNQSDQSVCTYGTGLSNTCLVKLGMPTIPAPITTTHPATTRTPTTTNTLSPTTIRSPTITTISPNATRTATTRTPTIATTTRPVTTRSTIITTRQPVTTRANIATTRAPITTRSVTTTRSVSNRGVNQIQDSTSSLASSQTAIKKNAANSVYQPTMSLLYWQTMAAALVALLMLAL